MDHAQAAQQMPQSFTGLLIATIVVLAGVIAVLFRLYVNRNKETDAALAKKDGEIASERKEWAVREASWEGEAERLRGDHERKLKEAAENYAVELAEMRERHLEREDAMRKDFGDRIERIAAEAAVAARAQNQVLEKMYERFIGPRRTPKGQY